MKSVPDRIPRFGCAPDRIFPALFPSVLRSFGGAVAVWFFLGAVGMFPFAARAVSAEGVPSAQEWVDSLPDSVVDKALESLWNAVPGVERRTPDSARRSALLGYLAGRVPGVRILRADAAGEQYGLETAHGFYTEVLPGRVAYMRPGALDAAACASLDAAMEDWRRLGIERVVVDLRAGERGGSLEMAAQIAGRFLPAGVPLFSVRRGVLDGAGDGQSAPDAPRMNAWSSSWAAAQKPASPHLVAVLVSGRTAGAAEALAAVLKFRARAVLIGHPTRGEAADFTEIALGDSGFLRVPVAEPVWPAGESALSAGGRQFGVLGVPIQPDIRTGDTSGALAAVLAAEVRDGKVAPFVAEPERLRNNEAALVAGRNPELEELIRKARDAKKPAGPAPLRDAGLKAALDFFKGWDVLRPR